MPVKRKKVAHVTFDMRIGGAEMVIVNLVENTDAKKYDVSILCLEEALGQLGRILIEKGFKITTLGRTPGFDWGLLWKIRRHIIENRIDLLHCHQYTPYSYGILASLGLNCEVIFTEHGRFFPDRRSVKRFLINPVLSFLTKKITAISASTLDALVIYENFNGKKIDLVYNGLDDARYLQPNHGDMRKLLGISPNAFVLGTVARLDSIKNQPLMIRALKQVKNVCPETVLVIIGDGPERNRLETMTRELQLEDSVIFTGFRTDVHRFYSVMDAFLLTSFSEGTAMTLIEAMASSLPSIVTDVGGNPEIVHDKETGFVIPSNSLEDLTAAVCRLVAAPEMGSLMGRRARLRFEQKYTVEGMVASYQALYC